MMLRTCVLSVCMIVVPGLALCSHHVPPELRAAARSAVWQPVVASVERWFAPSSPAEAVAAVAAEPTRPAPAAATAGAATATEPSTDHDRLVSLGAVAIECRPLETSADVHVASCRLAMDAAGQLQRVFQAGGSSPAAATSALVAQVEAWRERLVARADGPAPPHGTH
ncbi:MAG: hypothetical protein FJ284_03240 [Planctomycetes bacterium]|nr:hypothetical protein [Planctomycetota bacterium]